MPASQFLAFGTAVGANVLGYSDYNAAAWRLAGFSAGLATSQQLNTVWRQSSFVSAALAQAVADLTGNDVEDDGDLPAFIVALKAAIAAGSAAVTLAGMNVALAAGTGAPLIAKASAAGAGGYASLRAPHGAAPTTNIADGDIWTTTTGIFVRVNGATVQLASTGSIVSYTASGGITLSTADFRLSDMAEGTVKGRAAGAGTGAPSDLTPAQLNFMLGFTGTIVMRANPAVHAATELLCDGSAVSRATYANLFSVIGTTWGAGNGTTTFNLPAWRGKFPRAFDGGAGVDTGRVFAVTQLDAFKSHTHTTGETDPEGRSDGGTGNLVPDGSGFSDATSGATGDTETRPINETFYPCIKI